MQHCKRLSGRWRALRVRAEVLAKATRLVHPVFRVSERKISEPVGSIRTERCWVDAFPCKTAFSAFPVAHELLGARFFGVYPPFGGYFCFWGRPARSAVCPHRRWGDLFS